MPQDFALNDLQVDALNRIGCPKSDVLIAKFEKRRHGGIVSHRPAANGEVSAGEDFQS